MSSYDYRKVVPTTDDHEDHVFRSRSLTLPTRVRGHRPVRMTSHDPKCRNLAEFRDNYRQGEPEKQSLIRNICKCSKKRARNAFYSLVPSYRILKKYQWKTDFIADLICGLTVGIMQLPQGMAYALLAEMPPVVGLYMSFFLVLVYCIFGTSRHASMGTVAVVSLLTGSVVARFYTRTALSSFVGSDVNTTLSPNGSSGILHPAPDSEPNLPMEAKLGIAMSLSMLVGLVQIAMGVLRMGFVTTYMSDPLIAGFTTGTAIHVGTSQTFVHIFTNIHKTNIATLVISLVCVAILYTVKVHINQRFKHILKIPVPIELVVVVAGTLA